NRGSEEPLELFAKFNQFRILTPFRKGPFGYEALNALCHKNLAKTLRLGERSVIPIIVVATDYGLELFNGEVGILVCHHKVNEFSAFQKGDYALFPGNSLEKAGQSMRQIPAILLPKFEYAYCLSVHKSQGSEFERVLLLLPEGSEIFGREVLYTGVTRAR